MALRAPALSPFCSRARLRWKVAPRRRGSLQRIDGLERLVDLALLQQGVDQRHIRDHTLIGRSDALRAEATPVAAGQQPKRCDT